MWLGFYTNTPIIASSSIVIVEVNNNSNDLPGLKDDVDLDYILLELYRRVLAYNVKEAEKMVYKGGKKLIYKAGQIVLLAIPLKNRLTIEATRLPYHILTIIKGAYTLLSQHSPLKGRHQGSSLLIIKTQEDFRIPIKPLTNAKSITLPSAITLANNRKSISV
jgi:hypothetical protein